ncbi:VgrG-related protein [Streptacidiphilus anmyonensis]|uniref:VgrG-related protein n=1 Tax=Streptacidiphilus anmyonensis TaxID=405782 RepID=UPI0005A9E312|nr:VgrG-related protein [Streptacidiphilus anmyonensis]
MPDNPASMQVCTGSGRTPLSPEMHGRITRVVVDEDRSRPSMFEIGFRDVDGATLTRSGLALGTEVQVLATADGATSATSLIRGEVVALEGRYERLACETVVRGYDRAHRLQRVRRTRTFARMTDSAIVRRVLREVGLDVGACVEQTSAVHEHLGQTDQTDWDFLLWRARELGFHVGVADGRFYFCGPAAAGPSRALELGGNLREFRPRVTGGNLAGQVEVRVWDPIDAKAVAQSGPLSSATFTGGTSAERAAGPFGLAFRGELGAGVRDRGPAPSNDAYVVVDRQVATGAQIASAARLVADGVAEHMSSTFAEADGSAAGDPTLRPGTRVSITGVPEPFAGAWTVTGATHMIDLARGVRYVTEFRVGGLQDRSLLRLAQSRAAADPALPGLMCGIVSDTGDPRALGRVKVVLPLLAPSYESDWAPVMQLGGAGSSGTMFLPEVGDQVLLGFELQDPRRPYVLGAVVSQGSTFGLPKTAVRRSGEASRVVRRGFAAPSGNQLLFTDDMPQDGPPHESRISLGSGDGSLELSFDMVAGTVTVVSHHQDGKVTVSCTGSGGVSVQTGQGVPVEVACGGRLTLSGSEVEVRSQGKVTLSGAEVEVSGQGQVAVKGAQISLG